MWSSGKFNSGENILRISLSGSVSEGFWVLSGYNEDGIRSELRREAIAGDFTIIHDFDPICYAIYDGAVAFSVEALGECRVDSFEITVRENPHHTIPDVEAKFNDGRVRIFDLENREKWVDVLPHRVLFMGNSILAGMFMKYGMCASSPERDYAYIISQQILRRSPDCRFERVYSSPFEHSESEADFESWFSAEDNAVSGKRVCDSLTPDLDLVIIQLTDNVATPEKMEIFPRNARRLLAEIKERCPNARIIWVYGWFGRSSVFAMLRDLCHEFRIETVNISALHTKENEATSGQISLDADGGKIIVRDTWITHPGDRGMEAIAERIIERIFGRQ